jgi:hypothetical protein
MNRDRANGVNPCCSSAPTGVERLAGAVVMATRERVELGREYGNEIAVKACGIGALGDIEGNCSLACAVCKILGKGKGDDNKGRFGVADSSANDELKVDGINKETERPVGIVRQPVGVVADGSREDDVDLVASIPVNGDGVCTI